MKKMRARQRADDDAVEKEVRHAVRTVIRLSTGKKPQCEVHIARLQ
jgi:hypothetical protein